MRQVRGPERNTDEKARSLPQCTFDFYICYTVQSPKFLDQRETDPGPLKASSLGAFDAMKAFEQAGLLFPGNPYSRVGDAPQSRRAVAGFRH